MGESHPLRTGNAVGGISPKTSPNGKPPLQTNLATADQRVMAAPYYWDMMEATLTWDDISGTRNPEK